MKISSNKQLLDIIRNHEVGVRYPDLIPRIAFNILIQKDTTIYNPTYTYYPYFEWWFEWSKSREGYDYWSEIASTLQVVS